MPMSGSPEKRRDCIAQLHLRSTSGGSKSASEHIGRGNSSRDRTLFVHRYYRVFEALDIGVFRTRTRSGHGETDIPARKRVGDHNAGRTAMLFSGTGAAALPAVGPGMAGAVGGDEVRWKKIKELITRATADTPTAPKSRNLGDSGSTNGMGTVDVCFH